MTSNTSQKGRDNLSQTNIESLTVVNGVDEKRVREIVDEKLQVALASLSNEASKTAQSRVNKFSERLIDKMVRKNALEAFAEPSFQMLLVEAQKRAASTEREQDYDLLSELMAHRFEVGDNRTVGAGITKAIEIIDQVSDDALLGLTILYAVMSFEPINGNINAGLKALDDLYSKLLYAALPTDDNWLEHLDILGAIRLSTVGGIMTFENLLAKRLTGYAVGGIERGTEDFHGALEQLHSVGLRGEGLLVDHRLAKNRVRLPLVNDSQIDQLTIRTKGSIKYAILPEQQRVLKDIFALSNKTQIPAERMIREIEQYTHLKIVREWWNQLKNGFRITGVGKALAHTNAQRIDNALPSFSSFV